MRTVWKPQSDLERKQERQETAAIPYARFWPWQCELLEGNVKAWCRTQAHEKQRGLITSCTLWCRMFLTCRGSECA